MTTMLAEDTYDSSEDWALGNRDGILEVLHLYTYTRCCDHLLLFSIELGATMHNDVLNHVLCNPDITLYCT